MVDTDSYLELEKALQTSEARYRAVVEDLTDLVCRFHPDGTLNFVNEAYCRFFGCSEQDLVGTSLYAQVPMQERDALRAHFQALSPEKPVTTYEYTFDEGAGDMGWQQWTARAIWDQTGQYLEIQAVGRCITQLKRRELELQQSQAQLRSLASYLQSVREKERTSIAREIHDQMGQELTALKIGLVGLQNKALEADNGLEDELGEMIGSVEKMLQTVQKISTELRPAVLDHLGLSAAIEWQIGQFSKLTGIQCQLDLATEEITLAPAPSTALFRVLQEALTNIARHAQATQIDVSLKLQHDRIALFVEDNGVGISQAQAQNPASLGIVGMRERVLDFNGELNVSAGPGGGTQLMACLPMASPL